MLKLYSVYSNSRMVGNAAENVHKHELNECGVFNIHFDRLITIYLNKTNFIMFIITLY